MKAKRPLSTKIFLLAFANLLLLGLVFLVFMRAQYRIDLESFLLSPAQDRILAVARQFALELQDTDRASWDALLAKYSRAQSVQFTLLDERGAQIAGPPQVLPPSVMERVTHDSHHRDHGSPLLYLGASGDPTQHWVGVRIPLPHMDTPAQEANAQGRERHAHATLVAASSSLLGAFFFFDPKPWLAVICAVILISVGCWLPLVRGITKSISHMTRATAQIAEGKFEIQLPVNRADELGQLSASINRMSARLDGFVKGQKRFLGDAAHELCSPIARIQVALGLLERSATPEQSACFADLRDDIQEMSQLVNEILSFTKAGMQSSEMRLEPVDVAETVMRVLARATTEGARINTSIEPGTRALAHPDLLARAVSNVVRNSVRYAAAAGPIDISAQSLNGNTVIRVADCGPGLMEKDLEMIFEPFYRPELARQRTTGGVGLGMAIVKTCVEACHGVVECRNRTPSGLQVDITLKSA